MADEKTALPTTQRGLIQHVYAEPLAVEELPTPQPGPGSVVLQVVGAAIASYMRDVYNGTRKFPYPTPLIPGMSAVGRVAAVGPDATTLKPGQLVYFDGFIHSRDDPSAGFLSGVMDGGHPAGRTLMSGEWRDSSYAQYVKAPLENVHVLDEARLLGPRADGGLGLSLEQLLWLPKGLVPYGGLRAINLQPGETVLIAPATGGYSGGAVVAALAMGARVVAMGRNAEALKGLAALSERVRTVQITGDHEAEVAALRAAGPIDAMVDMSPPAAAGSTHLRSGILAVRKGGRVALMGGLLGDVTLPHFFLMRNNISLVGRWMYTRDELVGFLRMLEAGVLNLDAIKARGRYPLEKWAEAFDEAAAAAFNEVVMLAP